MDNSRSRSPRRKHRSRKSHSRSRSKRDAHRRSSSREDKHRHKKTEKTYESPFGVTDVYFSSTLAGNALCKLIKKDFPKMTDVDDVKVNKKKNVSSDEMSFIDPHVEEACRKILSRLEIQKG